MARIGRMSRNPLGPFGRAADGVVGMFNKTLRSCRQFVSGNAVSPSKLIVVAVFIAGLIAFFALGLHRFVTLEALERHHQELLAWVARYGAWALVVFCVVYAVAVAFSVPGGAVMTIAGGLLFGPFVTTACVVVSATVGATALFLAARYALADIVRARVGPLMARIEHGFNENGMSYMFVLRLIPLFPFWLVNLAPALLGVPLRTYVISTFFGIIPGTFVYSLVGAGAGAVFARGGDLDLYIIFEPRVLAPIVGLAVLALLPIAYKRWQSVRRRRKL